MKKAFYKLKIFKNVTLAALHKKDDTFCIILLSLPARERGLKSKRQT